MERLTGWDGDRAYIRNMPVVEMDAVALDLITAVVYRLAEYEDTGMDPEEIKGPYDSLKAHLYDVETELKVYQQAEAEGRFDSRKEARRFRDLLALLRTGAIEELKLQPEYTLQEAYTTPEGVRVRAIRYRADFSYKRGGDLVVEDVKSRATKTRVYETKKKLMLDRFGITIREVTNNI